MIRSTRGPRGILVALVGLAIVVGACAGPAAPQAAPTVAPLTLEQLVEAAKKEGKVLVADSSPEAQFTPVIAAFKLKYPGVEVQQLSQSSAEAIQQMTAEVQANRASTTDVLIGGLAQLSVPEKDGLLLDTNWSGVGISPELIASPAQLKAVGALTVFVYNKTQVTGADIPKTWDDFAAAKWKGKTAIFPTGDIAADLSLPWGEARTTEYWTKLVAQSTLAPTPPDVANKVAAGEFAIGLARIQHARAQIARGAPLGFVVPNPAIFSVLSAVIPKTAAHPNAARLFIAWLASIDGANAYEKATFRGNALVAGSQAAADVKGLDLVTWDPKKQSVEERAKLEAKYLQITQRK